MAADSDGSTEPFDDSVTTIVTCEGDYYDPTFHDKFKQTIDKLENILCKEQPRKQTSIKNSPCRTEEEKCCDASERQCIRVAKLEPWNSVRVTLSIPREVAARLRQMANEGSEQLRQLGILSVQVEGDQVISLRIASRFGNENETQEIVLNTAAAGTSTASTSQTVQPVPDQVNPLSASTSSITRFLQNTTPSAVQQPGDSRVNSEFRSPNVVCPSDTQVPLKGGLVQQGTPRGHEPLSRPFPFASMQQAAIAIQNRQQGVATSTPSHTQPPPPYPSNKVVTTTATNSPPNIAISSPLLVNLLQNEGQKVVEHGKVPAKNVPSLPQVVTTSVPSQLSKPTPAPPLIVTSNPRQAQQLRTLQQQLIQKQTQQRLLNQRVTVAPTVVQNQYLTTTTPTPAAQPPPYPGNRQLFRVQQRVFNNPPFPTVPDFTNQGNSSVPIAQPMPHLGHHLDTSLLNITPSLTDLSKDLDSLLPSLADLDGTDLNDIVDNLVSDDVVEAITQHATLQKPIEVPDEVTSKGKKRVYLINPTNGELEPMPSDESSVETDASDSEDRKKGVMDVFSELNDYSNSIYSDEDTNSMSGTSSIKRGVFDTNSDSSDTNKTTDSSNNNKSHRKNFAKFRRDSPSYIKSSSNSSTSSLKMNKEKTPTEKIKLRLKLEKSEPVNPAYKVDLSFINRQEPKRVNSSPTTISNPISSAITHTTAPPLVASNSSPILPSSLATTNNISSTNPEEPRVPPLHISLRGRNSVVISNKSSKKHLSKSSSGDDSLSNDEKLLKKSKIRSKDKEMLKIKARSVYDDVKTKTELDEVMPFRRTDSTEIPVPPLKSLSSSPLSPQAAKLKQKIIKDELSESLLNDLTNHKNVVPSSKPPDFLNKIVFKTNKLDKVKKEELKSFDDMKSLKRQHSSSPVNSYSVGLSPEISSASLVNGVVHSPDSKKRKLSDSILEIPVINPATTTVVCMTSIGSTNIGTIPAMSNIQNNTETKHHNNSSNNTNNMSSKSSSPNKLPRSKDKDHHRPNLLDPLNNKSPNDKTQYRLNISSKSKDLNRDKTYSKIVAEKRQNQEKFAKATTEVTNSNKLNALSLPTGEIDMEAKFKQRLLEDSLPVSTKARYELTKERDKAILINKTSKVVLNRMDDTILHNRLLAAVPVPALTKLEPKVEPKNHSHKSIESPQVKDEHDGAWKDLMMLDSKVLDDKLEDNLRLLLEEAENEDEGENNRIVQAESLGDDINLAQILTDPDIKPDDQEEIDNCSTNNKPSENLETSEITTSSSTTTVQTTTASTTPVNNCTSTTTSQPNRSPPLSNSTGQGEDSGIESMDALSEKSPNNQSSQSPHCHHTEIISNLVDTLTGKDSPTNNLKDFKAETIPTSNNDLAELGDIEAELAKMEGDFCQNGGELPEIVSEPVDNLVEELECKKEEDDNKDEGIFLPKKMDLNENCDKKDEEKANIYEFNSEVAEDKFVKKEKSELLNHLDNDFDPLPIIRRTPPLYTYSNPDKQILRNDTDSPLIGLSDLDDVNSECCQSDLNSEDLNDILLDTPSAIEKDVDNTTSTNSKSLRQRSHRKQAKNSSLLEQLLIDIPNSEFLDNKSNFSPAISEKSISKSTTTTRSTRSTSKLNSPDIVNEAKHNLRTQKHSPSVPESKSRANSPAVLLNRASPKMSNKPGLKRKRRESESSTQSTQSTEEAVPVTRAGKKPRNSDKPTNKINKKGKITNNRKATPPVTPITTVPETVATINLEESSDSDEPLIEVAGKVRHAGPRTKVKPDEQAKLTVRRSVRHNNTTVVTTVAPVAGVITTSSGIGLKTRSKLSGNNGNAVVTVSSASPLGVGVSTTTASVLTAVTTGQATVLSTAAVVTAVSSTVAENSSSVTTTSPVTESVVTTVANRRKTRSAVTESAQEKRTRRNSKDGK